MVLVFTFFYFEKCLLLIPFFKKRFRRFIHFDFSSNMKWQFLFWSLLRHLIFTLQFIFVLNFFNVEISFNLMFWIWQVYFWVTLSPSLFLGKIVIRESISVWVLSAAGLQPSIVVLSSIGIWVLNLFIPTIFSLIFCKAPIATST